MLRYQLPPRVPPPRVPPLRVPPPARYGFLRRGLLRYGFLRRGLLRYGFLRYGLGPSHHVCHVLFTPIP